MNYLLRYEFNGIIFTVTNERDRYQGWVNGIMFIEGDDFELVRDSVIWD